MLPAPLPRRVYYAPREPTPVFSSVAEPRPRPRGNSRWALGESDSSARFQAFAPRTSISNGGSSNVGADGVVTMPLLATYTSDYWDAEFTTLVTPPEESGFFAFAIGEQTLASDRMLTVVLQLVSGEDADGDGTGSDLDAGVPSDGLGGNRWAYPGDPDGYLATTDPGDNGKGNGKDKDKDKGPDYEFTLEDTGGCGVSQIIQPIPAPRR